VEDREGVIRRMKDADVGTITIGVDYETSCEAIEIARQYDFIWAGIGLHPADNVDEEFDVEKYKLLAVEKKVVCIGECGLDYFRVAPEEREVTKERQKDVFKKHIELALAVGKPLMIHARPSKGSMDAYEDVLDILEEYTSPLPVQTGQYFHSKGEGALRGNFHFFVGNVAIAKRALAIGFTMSFDGPITFSRDYDEVLQSIPLDMIMVETDAPFAAPVPYRGKTCEPYMVTEIVKKIAQIKGLPEEEVAVALNMNAQRIFKML
jgi:TatD DNase family protein